MNSFMSWVGGKKALREEVVRLGLLARIGLDRDTLEDVASKLSREELLAMEGGCRRRAAERYPLLPQLQYQQDQAPEEDRDRAFLICLRKPRRERPPPADAP